MKEEEEKRKQTQAEREAGIDDVCSFFDCKIEEMDQDFEALEERLRLLR